MKDEIKSSDLSSCCQCKKPGFFTGKGFKILVFFFILVCYLLWNTFTQTGIWGAHFLFVVMLFTGLVYACAKTNPIFELLTWTMLLGAAYFAVNVLKIEALREIVEVIFSKQQIMGLVLYVLILNLTCAILDKSRFRVIYLYTVATIGFVGMLYEGLNHDGNWPTYYLHSLDWVFVVPIWLFSLGVAICALHHYCKKENPVSATLYILFYCWVTASGLGGIFYKYRTGNDEAITLLFLVALMFIIITLGSSSTGKKVAKKTQKPVERPNCEKCGKPFDLMSADGTSEMAIPPGVTPRSLEKQKRSSKNADDGANVVSEMEKPPGTHPKNNEKADEFSSKTAGEGAV